MLAVASRVWKADRACLRPNSILFCPRLRITATRPATQKSPHCEEEEEEEEEDNNKHQQGKR
jgi:hypothetical protein